MRLYQNQTYRVGDAYVRIIHLDRLKVDYKELTDPDFREGTHRSLTKKEFCRLVKKAILLVKTERGEWREPSGSSVSGGSAQPVRQGLADTPLEDPPAPVA